MKLKIIVLCAVVLLVATLGLSQQQPHPQPGQPGQPPPAHGPDPIGQNLFPPELIMQNRQAIGLSDEQKTAIRDELVKASTRFSELQWQMQDEIETMANLTKAPVIDEQRALAQLDKILSIERDVKRAQFTVSIRIKNKLTADQQAKLQEIQRNMHVPR